MPPVVANTPPTFVPPTGRGVGPFSRHPAHGTKGRGSTRGRSTNLMRPLCAFLTLMPSTLVCALTCCNSSLHSSDCTHAFSDTGTGTWPGPPPATNCDITGPHEEIVSF